MDKNVERERVGLLIMYIKMYVQLMNTCTSYRAHARIHMYVYSRFVLGFIVIVCYLYGKFDYNIFAPIFIIIDFSCWTCQGHAEYI